MGRLNGKVALVTGAAGGIGEATARLFAAEGARVAVADVDRKGELVADAIRTDGGDAHFLELDVSSEAAWRAGIDGVVGRYGQLNVLVNNAGVSLNRDVEDATLDEWERVMAVNAAGAFLGCKHAIPAMRASGQPCSIINRSSIEALIGEPARFAYSASKGAITALTRALAIGCGEKGDDIRVNTVLPGWIQTDLIVHGMQARGLDPDAEIARIAGEHPVGCVGQPADVAYLDVYLASDESRFVTGASFVIDGGWTAR